MMRHAPSVLVTAILGALVACGRAPEAAAPVAPPPPIARAPAPAMATTAAAQRPAASQPASAPPEGATPAPDAASPGDDVAHGRLVVIPADGAPKSTRAPATKQPTPLAMAKPAIVKGVGAKPAPTARVAEPRAQPRPARTVGGGVTLGGNIDPSLTPVDREPHLAVGATVSVSASHLGTAGEDSPAALVDGDPTTRWSSAFADHQWITLDLHEAKTVGRVRLLWELAAARAWSISSSADGATWTPLSRRDDEAAGPRVDDVDLTPTTTRWLRIDLEQRATAWGFSLFEVEVLPPR